MNKASRWLTCGSVLLLASAVVGGCAPADDEQAAVETPVALGATDPSPRTIFSGGRVVGGTNAFTVNGVQASYKSATLHGALSGNGYLLPIPSTVAGVTARVYWDKASSTPASVYNSVNLATASDHSDVYANGVRVGSAHYVSGGTIYADIPLTGGVHTNATLSVTTGGATYSATASDLFAMKVSPFILLADTFHADRCVSCHSLGSSTAISNFHVSRGAWAAPRPLAQPDSAAECNSCHAAATANDVWRSPSFAKGMNFNAMTTSQICQAVTSHMDASALREHLFGDPRVGWALESGVLPNGIQRAPAAPYSSVEAWILAGDLYQEAITTGIKCDSLVWFP